MIVFTIITLGLYGIYWYIAFQVELKRQTKLGFGGFAHFIVSLITFGIYSLYWQYAAGKRLEKQGANDLSVLYLILCFTPFSWLNPYIMQSQANNLKKKRA